MCSYVNKLIITAPYHVLAYIYVRRPFCLKRVHYSAYVYTKWPEKSGRIRFPRLFLRALSAGIPVSFDNERNRRPCTTVYNYWLYLRRDSARSLVYGTHYTLYIIAVIALSAS